MEVAGSTTETNSAEEDEEEAAAEGAAVEAEAVGNTIKTSALNGLRRNSFHV